MRAQVDGKTILDSGSVVLQKGNQLSFRPLIDDNPPFYVKVSIDYSREKPSTLSVNADISGNSALVSINYNPQDGGSEVSNSAPISIGRNRITQDNYFINIAINLIGSTDQYTVVLFYTVFSEAKP